MKKKAGLLLFGTTGNRKPNQAKANKEAKLNLISKWKKIHKSTNLVPYAINHEALMKRSKNLDKVGFFLCTTKAR
jgi:hypothetical protein